MAIHSQPTTLEAFIQGLIVRFFLTLYGESRFIDLNNILGEFPSCNFYSARDLQCDLGQVTSFIFLIRRGRF